MRVIDAVTTCLQRTGDVRGTTGRADFWCFVVWAGVVMSVLVATVTVADAPVVTGAASVALILLGICVLSAGVRRLHDTGYSGWMALLVLVPFGGLVLLAFCCSPTRTAAEGNRWADSAPVSSPDDAEWVTASRSQA